MPTHMEQLIKNTSELGPIFPWTGTAPDGYPSRLRKAGPEPAHQAQCRGSEGRQYFY